MSFRSFRAGYTYLETIIALGVFTYLLFITFHAVMITLEHHSQGQQSDIVTLELHGPLMRTFGAYIRSATGIWYGDSLLTKNNDDGTVYFEEEAVAYFDRKCSESITKTKDKLTVFLNQERTDFITFAVEYNQQEGTSRMVFRRKEEDWRYMHSEETFITCFLVSPSLPPDNKMEPPSIIDIQPYVTIQLAAGYREEGQDVSTIRPKVSYQTTFTLRNYSY